MPQWFLPYTAAALIAVALGWLALNYDPDAGEQTAKPVLAGSPAPGKPVAQAPTPAPAAASSPAPAPETPPSANDEAAVRSLVTRSLTTDLSADCTRLYTQAFLEQLSGDSGSEAVENCRENADSKADADSVAFQEVSRTGDTYRVAVALEGGELAGSLLEVAIVRSAGSWKIDRLLEVDIDMQQQAEIARSGMLDDGYSDADADCLARKVLEVDEARYERAVTEGRASQIMGEVVDASYACLGAGALRRELAEGIRKGARDAPEALIRCVIDRIVGGKSVYELRALVQMDSSAGFEAGRQAALECARSMAAAPTAAS